MFKLAEMKLLSVVTLRFKSGFVSDIRSFTCTMFIHIFYIIHILENKENNVASYLVIWRHFTATHLILIPNKLTLSL